MLSDNIAYKNQLSRTVQKSFGFRLKYVKYTKYNLLNL